MTPSRQVDTFVRHALPGMTLLAPKRYREDIVRRCVCGKPISENKQACLECLLKELAVQIETQEILDATIARNWPNDREKVLRIMRPHLKFEPQE